MTDHSPKDGLREGAPGDHSHAPAPPLLPLILLTALSVVPVNIILPSLPKIAAEFRADVSLVSLAVAGYALATALIEIIAGRLADRYGRRPVALTAIAMFILASIGCALAGNIILFLIFRALQASIAACFSIALVMIKETSRGAATVSRFGYLAMGWALAPMLAPLVGGLLDWAWGWRAIFLALATAGAILLVLSWMTLRETATAGAKADGRRGSYSQLLGSRQFWCCALCMAFAMGTLYLFLSGAPIAVGSMLGGSTAKLGLCMGLVPAGFMLGSFLAGRFAALASLGTILVIARSLTCAGLLIGLGLSVMGVTHVAALFGPCIFIGVGNGLTMPAANAGVLSVHPEHAGTAAGLAAAISIGGGALIVALGGWFIGGRVSVAALFATMLCTATLALIAAIGANSAGK